MTNTGTEPTGKEEEEEEEKNDNAVLPQIGEDPGPSADVMEEKIQKGSIIEKRHKRNKDLDLRESKE
jgi:hypothetical protein